MLQEADATARKHGSFAVPKDLLLAVDGGRHPDAWLKDLLQLAKDSNSGSSRRVSALASFKEELLDAYKTS